jgi:hypothetical protein
MQDSEGVTEVPLMVPDVHQTYIDPVQQNTTNISVSNSGRKMKAREPDVDTDVLPRLHFHFRWFFLFSYILFLLVLNVLIPCLLFYILLEGMLRVHSADIYSPTTMFRPNYNITGSSGSLGCASWVVLFRRFYR